MSIPVHVPDWEKHCWVVALRVVTGKSEAAIVKQAKKHGWKEGVTGGALGFTETVMVLWDLTGKKPDASLTRSVVVEQKLTAREFSATRPVGKGIVIVKGHVMPFINGKVSNFNGYGDEKVAAVYSVPE